MRKRNAAVLVALVLTLMGSSTMASAASRDGGLANAHLARVKPGIKRFFYRMGETAGCPALTDRCRRKGYVMPGDVLLAWGSSGAFTSVEFVTPNGQHSAGAIETASLEPVSAEAAPPLSAWIGEWTRDSEAHIGIKAIGGGNRLAVTGNALWGTKDPVRVRNGGINDGELDGAFVPSGAWGGVLESGAERVDWQRAFPFNSEDSYECRVQLRLVGPYLLVNDDENHCGGVNVTFSGVYRK